MADDHLVAPNLFVRRRDRGAPVHDDGANAGRYNAVTAVDIFNLQGLESLAQLLQAVSRRTRIAIVEKQGKLFTPRAGNDVTGPSGELGDAEGRLGQSTVMNNHSPASLAGFQARTAAVIMNSGRPSRHI